MKKRLAMILTVLMLTVFTLPLPVLAGAHSSKTPPPDTPQAVTPLSTLWLSAWNCSISQQNSSTVQLSGYSEANVPVNQIWVILYLQQWNGSQWVTISNGYRATGNNTVSITGKQTLTVTPGHYYRTTGNHQCYNNGIYDPSQPKVSTSTSIYVD